MVSISISELARNRQTVMNGRFRSSHQRIIASARDSFVGRIKRRNGEFALYRWKPVQNFMKAFAILEVIEKGADYLYSPPRTLRVL